MFVWVVVGGSRIWVALYYSMLLYFILHIKFNTIFNFDHKTIFTLLEFAKRERIMRIKGKLISTLN